MTDTADLIAFVRAAKGQVTNRMALDLAAALETANQTTAELGADLRDAQREVEVLTSALEAAEKALDDELRKAREGWDGWQEQALAAEARRDTLAEAIRHVVNDSPGTPDSVRRYLLRALEGSWGDPYESAMLAAVEPPEEPRTFGDQLPYRSGNPLPAVEPPEEGVEVTEHRWEIGVLIGPCDMEDAEWLMNLVFKVVQGRLGACVSLRPWDEDNVTAQPAYEVRPGRWHPPIGAPPEEQP